MWRDGASGGFWHQRDRRDTGTGHALDARAGALCNTWPRTSTNGGASWSSETDLSTYVAGFGYIQPAGYAYPYGDYWELTIDGQGRTHAVWGEGLNYDSPGSIWYARAQ